MQKNPSALSLLNGIKEVLSKHRASLTAEDVETLENTIQYLKDFDSKYDKNQQYIFGISIIFQLFRTLLNPDVAEKIKSFLEDIL